METTYTKGAVMTKRVRDITKGQFAAACKRRGFIGSGFMGYHQLGNTNTSVSIHNAGTRRRDQLAYLIREHEKARKRMDAAQEAKALNAPETQRTGPIGD